MRGVDRTRVEETINRLHQSPPTASTVFRVLAGLLSLAFVIVPMEVAGHLMRGLPLSEMPFGGLAQALALIGFWIMIVWVALVGRVPQRLYGFMRHSQ